MSQLAGRLTVPPNALTLGRGAAPGDLEWVARVTGARLRALGLDWVFAPVADIHSEPLNPVIGPRAWGTTAAEVTARVGELLRGYRAAGGWRRVSSISPGTATRARIRTCRCR